MSFAENLSKTISLPPKLGVGEERFVRLNVNIFGVVSKIKKVNIELVSDVVRSFGVSQAKTEEVVLENIVLLGVIIQLKKEKQYQLTDIISSE